MKKPSRDPASLVTGSNEAISARLEEIERKLDRLRSMYEVFFSGVERQPPSAPRRELNRLMLETQQVHINNAALRFRFQSLSQKWALMTTYWNRTLREIETGTYRKDLAKVSRRLAQKGVPLSEQEAIALGIPAARARALVARQAAAQARVAGAEPQPAAHAPAALPPMPSPTPPPPPRQVTPVRAAAGAATVPGMSDDDLVALHRRYDEAARTTDRPAPSLARLKEQLAKRVPALMAQLGADRVTFEVAVKEGRVVLRPKAGTTKAEGGDD